MEAMAARVPSRVRLEPNHLVRPKHTPHNEAMLSPMPRINTPANAGRYSCMFHTSAGLVSAALEEEEEELASWKAARKARLATKAGCRIWGASAAKKGRCNHSGKAHPTSKYVCVRITRPESRMSR